MNVFLTTDSTTRQLEAERDLVASRLHQSTHASDTDSMQSITNTEESFQHNNHHHPHRHHHHPPTTTPTTSTINNNNNYYYQSPHCDDEVDSSYHGGLGLEEGNADVNASEMSSHLLDSCLRELEDRGTLNSGYIRDSGNMDYMHEDPYAGHHFQPHNYTGGGGGGYNDDYHPANASFDRHSEQSDRNRIPDSYHHLPNGGPYSETDVAPEHAWNRSSPQPPRSLTPQEGYPPFDSSSDQRHQHPLSSPYGDSDSREGNAEHYHHHHQESSPYHNLPPQHQDRFHNSSPKHYYDDGGPDGYRPDDHGYTRDGEVTPQPPGPTGAPYRYHPDNGDGYYHEGKSNPQLPGDDVGSGYPAASLSQAPDSSLHAGYGDREGSYAGSRGSFQGLGDPTYGSNYSDPYAGGRYNVEDQYHDGPDGQNGMLPQGDYSFQGDPQAPVGPGHGGDPAFDDNGLYDPTRDPRYPNQSPYLEDDRYPQPEDYRDVHNRSTGPMDDPYNTSYNPHQQPPPPQHDESFRDPYAQPVQHNYNSYEPDRFSDIGRPRSRQSYDQGYGDPQSLPPSHPNESFRDMPPDMQPPYDGLPPIQSDPFSHDPFQKQAALHPMDDPHYRGASPSGGIDQNYPSNFDDIDPQFQGQPYPGDLPDGYNQEAGYPGPHGGGSDVGPYGDEGYFHEQEAMQRLEQLNLNAPPPMEGRNTPSVDGRSLPPTMFPRNPDLQEVIDFLKSDDNSIKASAAAYLQHLTYMDDDMKAKTRSTGGISALIRLLNHELIEVHKNACGALRNLSYGKNNNDNKRSIKTENGIPELIRLLRKTDQEDVKESVTSVLWNLSSCEDLKQAIIEDGLTVLVNVVISKYTGYNSVADPWTTVLRNTTGILRNVSSAGFDARKRLRECRGMINSLIYILKIAVSDPASNDIDNKPVENTVCILRNLSFRIQEVVVPDFYKNRTLPRQETLGGSSKSKGGESPGCFGNKSKKTKTNQSKAGSQQANPPLKLPQASVEYRSLWGSEIHSLYSTILRKCTNPITMEAAAGAIQNLTACDWQPAVESREMVRKEKGLPLLVDLLSAESERVVCATATALRNLAFDEKNKELIGKYSIPQLVNRLPRDNRCTLQDDTICAVIATLFEVIKDNQSVAMSLVSENGAMPRLMHINRSEGRYLQRTLKFTLTLLKTLYGFKSLHSVYAQQNYTANDFNTSNAVARTEGSRPPTSAQSPSSNHTTPYNTLSRPMANQGYDDNTLTPARAQHIQRAGGGYHPHQNSRGPSPVYGLNSDYQCGPPPNYTQAIPDYARSNVSLHDNRDHLNYSRDRIPPEEIRLNDMGPGYAPLDEPRPHPAKPPVGGVPLFPTLNSDPHGYPYPDQVDPQNGNEPLYAQVKKGSRRRLDPYADNQQDGHASTTLEDGGGGGADSWV